MKVLTGTSMPMSLTSKPLMSSMKLTMFLPMSCKSPCTVPISTLPSLALSPPSCCLISGLATAPTVSSISPASTSSGRKYSPSSKRLPTMSMAARHSSSTRRGSAPSSNSILLDRAKASSSFMSDSHSTSCFSCSFMSFMVLVSWGVKNSYGMQTGLPAQTTFGNDLGEDILVLVAHHVDAGDALDAGQRLDGLDAYLLGFGFLVSRGCDACQQRWRYMDAWHMIGHPAQCLGAAQGANADDDVRALVQLALADPAHEDVQHRQIETELSLD